MIEMWVAPRITYTRPFVARADAELLYRFTRRFESVSQYFPEIRGVVKIGLTTVYKGLAATESDGYRMMKKISFPPLRRSGLPSRYVIGHEMMHIVQAKSKHLPSTERSCDLHTLARLPSRYIDHLPIYLRVPKKVRLNWSNPAVRYLASNVMHDLAIEAVVTRKSNPRYIQWWEEELSDYANRSRALIRVLEDF